MLLTCWAAAGRPPRARPPAPRGTPSTSFPTTPRSTTLATATNDSVELKEIGYNNPAPKCQFSKQTRARSARPKNYSKCVTRLVGLEVRLRLRDRDPDHPAEQLRSWHRATVKPKHANSRNNPTTATIHRVIAHTVHVIQRLGRVLGLLEVHEPEAPDPPCSPARVFAELAPHFREIPRNCASVHNTVSVVLGDGYCGDVPEGDERRVQNLLRSRGVQPACAHMAE